MIGTSLAEYGFVRVSIFFLHSVAPFSILYSLLLFFLPHLPSTLSSYRAPFLVELWLLSETAFFTSFFLPYRFHLQRSAIHPEPGSREQRAKLFDKCNANIKDPEKYLNGWFPESNNQPIKRGNLKDFIAWAFLNTGHRREEDEDEIEDYTKGVEKLLGRKLPPGNDGAESARLTLGECISVVDVKMYCTMWLYGFHFYRTSLGRFFSLFPYRPLTLLSAHKSPVTHLTYWHRPHSSKDRLPILFIHGIGVGLYPYTDFLRELYTGRDAKVDSAEIGIVALEIMPVSSRITHPALAKDTMVQEIRAIALHHGWSRFVLVAHSYGSILATHLLKSPDTSTLIGPVVFVDPVSFLLHLPDVAHNFTVRKPSQGNEHVTWYFGSKDMGVAHTLARRFFWSENIIWKEDLGLEGKEGEQGRDVTVLLSGKDIIVDTRAVRCYLTASSQEKPTAKGKAMETTTDAEKTNVTEIFDEEAGDLEDRPWSGSGLELLWFENLEHGHVFNSRRTRKPLLKAIDVYSAKG
ncbi:MAG: hypothetical protein M1831_001392 [Alyxoria varia]|nr:MAG: hypothetical protein M1831_001392 [Alyxoria varia]